MKKLLKNAQVINEGSVIKADVLIQGERITKIATEINDVEAEVIDLSGKFLMPGVIDDQVHFREPGLTHKGRIYTEAKAAVAGGITSFMEMPNTKPQALTQELLEDKYQIGAKDSLANYSFFMGASNENLEQVLKTDPKHVAGIKIFMGSSTGNMLVDDKQVLNSIFSKCDMLIAVHCEDEETIRNNSAKMKAEYGEDLPIRFHSIIRNVEACYKSSSMAVELANKYNTRLHILHISTAKETALFRNDIPLKEKRITAEACIHHLWFEESSYDEKGTFIKWNPAVKSAKDREGIWEALLDDRIDIIPVSDPNIFSQAQRIALAQTTLQIAQSAPQIIDIKEAYKRLIMALNLPDPDELVIDDDDIARRDPVSENMALLNGKPIKAFPDQVHAAHMLVHEQFISDPRFGGRPEAKEALLGPMLAHIGQHLAFQYRQQMQASLQGQVQLPLPDFDEDNKIEEEILFPIAREKLLFWFPLISKP